MLMVELLHVLKIAPGRLQKSCRNITHNMMPLILVIIAPSKSKHLGFNPPYVWWMFTFSPGCIGIGHRLRWTLDSAQLELRMLLVPATISCVLKWGKRFFFFEWAAVLAVLLESTSVLSFAVDQKTTPWSGFRKSLCQIFNSEFHDVQH